MNSVVIKGRLTKDVEIFNAESGTKIANFSVAVNRRFNRDQTDFFDVVAFGKTAEFLSAYFSKGQEILISGSMQQRKWKTKEGENRYSWELVAENVEFCGSKGEQSQVQTQTPIQREESQELQVIENDDDLPF